MLGKHTCLISGLGITQWGSIDVFIEVNILSAEGELGLYVPRKGKVKAANFHDGEKFEPIPSLRRKDSSNELWRSEISLPGHLDASQAAIHAISPLCHSCC